MKTWLHDLSLSVNLQKHNWNWKQNLSWQVALQILTKDKTSIFLSFYNVMQFVKGTIARVKQEEE